MILVPLFEPEVRNRSCSTSARTSGSGHLDASLANASNRAKRMEKMGIMPKRSLIGTVVLFVVLAVAFAGYLWWRYSVDERLGYCQTPRQTCVNRKGIPVGQPCECHGPGGGVFGLDSKGTVIAR
jgi:hypothetical protein